MEAWIARQLAAVVKDPDSVEQMAAHLAKQKDAAALRREAAGLVGQSKAARRKIEDIVSHVFSKAKLGPLNCLACGFVNGVRVPDGDVKAEDAYSVYIERLNRTREAWPKCEACGSPLNEQLRSGDVEDADLDKAVALAARLVRYDRETAQRTRVIDDQLDWYETPYDDGDDRPRFTIDFTTRAVVEEGVEEAKAPAEEKTPVEEKTPAEEKTPVEEKAVEPPFSVMKSGELLDEAFAAKTLAAACEVPPACLRTKLDKRKLRQASVGYCVLAEGLVLLRGALTAQQQRAVVDVVEASARDNWAVPTYADGARLHCHMCCYGKRWDPTSNVYVDTKPNGDTLPPLPSVLVSLATWAANAAFKLDPAVLGASGTYRTPDLLLANFYSPSGKLGLHQDTGERKETIDAGAPVVSMSVGATAHFSYAHRRPTDDVVPNAPPQTATLHIKSGDILLFGGPSRLLYHGVDKIMDATRLPPALGLRPGRLNLTFRAH